MLPPLSADAEGRLLVGGLSVAELAEEFGTPLYVTDEARLRENYRRLRDAFKTYYPRFQVNYAVKANSNLSIISVLRQEGAGADCSNLEEISLARMAGVPPEKVIYTGNYPSEPELRGALDSGVAVNLDDADLLPRLLRHGVPNVLSFRVNPGVGAGSHPGLVVGGAHTKFGVEEPRVLDAYRAARDAGVKRFGIHMMTGSNILDADYFPTAASRLLGIASRVSEALGIDFEFVDIGGGFGVPYRPGEQALNILGVAQKVCRLLVNYVDSGALGGQPTLIVEPGRYLVADTTVLVGRVHHVKRTSTKVYVGTDIGMNNLIRPMLYGAYHHVYIDRRATSHQTENVDVTGQICENTDIVATNRSVPHAEPGDVVVIATVGAYGYSMSSQYNNRPRPAEVLVNRGQVDVIRVREQLADLLRGQHVPPRLLK